MSASSPPQPLTATDCNLRSFEYMPLDVARLLTSETWIEAADDPKLGHSLICLWCESWHQVPAASLPDNLRVIARLAMCDGADWDRIGGRALEGWTLCSDGRWYHPVVAEKALEAWIEKLTQRKSSAAGNARRWGAEVDPALVDRDLEVARAMLAALNPDSRTLRKRVPRQSNPHSGGTPGDIPSGSQQTRTEQTRKKEQSAVSAGESADEDRFYSRLKALEERGIGRSRCMQLLAAVGNDFVEANRVLDAAETAKKPANYLGGAIRNLQASSRAAPPGANPNVPEWVNDRRRAGIVVDRDGQRWRSQGEILNDAGEVVGF